MGNIIKKYAMKKGIYKFQAVKFAIKIKTKYSS